MKKTFNILLLIFYTSFTIGISVTTTYCAGTSLAAESHSSSEESVANECCNTCEIACCFSKVETLKIEDSHNYHNSKIVFSNQCLVIISENSVKELNEGNSSYLTGNTYYSPPSTERYIFTQSLLI